MTCGKCGREKYGGWCAHCYTTPKPAPTEPESKAKKEKEEKVFHTGNQVLEHYGATKTAKEVLSEEDPVKRFLDWLFRRKQIAAAYHDGYHTAEGNWEFVQHDLLRALKHTLSCQSSCEECASARALYHRMGGT